MSTKKALKVQLPSAVDDATGLRQLEHYYGIEFVRGASNGGGNNGYYKMIGDAELLSEMRFHNLLKIASVKDAQTKTILNPVNWRQTVGGAASVLDGSDGADIMQITHDGEKPVGLYAICGGTNATYERFIVSDEYFEYDGDQAQFYPAYGETPDYATILANQLRSVRNETVIGTANVGISSENFSDPQYGNANGGGFPKTQLNRFQYEAAARAKNANANSNLPYTIINTLDDELTMALLAIEFRTKLFNTCLGHGVSANAAPDAATWGKITGIRFTADGGQTYTYGTLGTSLFVNGASTASAMWAIINNYCPLTKMFEAQLAVSDGATLEAVHDADGNAVQGISQGVMTGIYTKTFSFTVPASTVSGGTAQNMTVEVCLRIPVWRGRNRLWGNLTQWKGGIEALRYRDGEGNTHHKIYRAPSIEALTIDSDVVVKSQEGDFAFESAYDYIGETPVTAGGGGIWAQRMLSKGAITTAIAALGGGGMLNYEGACTYLGVEATEGTYRRMGALFGDLAFGSFAVFRFAILYYEPSYWNTYLGSGFRVKLTA